MLLKNARVLDPYTQTDAICDLLIDPEGNISKIEHNIHADCAQMDLTGKTIAPGFVDTHVHFRDPGQTEKEDIETGARAAAAGGYTTVVCMANTIPVCDNADTLRFIKNKAALQNYIHILQACAVTQGLRGSKITDFGALLSLGAAGFTDDGINLTDFHLAEAAMRLAVANDTLLSFHEEDPALVLSPGVNFGSAAAKSLGLPGAKAEAEESMIERDIALARKTGARVVFQHISSARSVDLIRQGKTLGAKIYCEATPHHIALTEDIVLTHGTNARMNPPLRTERDRHAIWEGLRDGTIDMIATDHAPHTAAEKAKQFGQAPSGIIGLETAFSVCNTALVKTGILTPMQLLEKMSRNPAQIYTLPNKAITVGNHAEFAILDWNEPVVYRKYHSKASNTPFTGMPLTGRVLGTVFGNRLNSFDIL